jgi:hypothetical protein
MTTITRTGRNIPHTLKDQLQDILPALTGMTAAQRRKAVQS